jgi:hypothetical protein
MPSVIAAEDLEKAAANLGRIERYFASRRSWDAASPDRFRTFRDAVRSVGEVVQDLVQLHGIPMTPPPLAPEEPLPADVLDVGRLDKFTAFVTQLAQWFEAARGHEIDAEAKPAMATVFASLAALASHLDAISATLPQPATAAAPDPLRRRRRLLRSHRRSPSTVRRPASNSSTATRRRFCRRFRVRWNSPTGLEVCCGASSRATTSGTANIICRSSRRRCCGGSRARRTDRCWSSRSAVCRASPEPYPSYVRRSVGEDVYSGPD